VPMHTALRLGAEVAARMRAINPSCHVCFYGLYATLNADELLARGADSVLAGEMEDGLVELARLVEQGTGTRAVSLPNGADAPLATPPAPVPRRDPAPRPSSRMTRVTAPSPILVKLDFPVPSRAALPALERYAHVEIDGRRDLAGHVESTRGCRHTCRHCPIPPVYGGRFFVVPREVVLDDVRQQVGAGARHITFGDPDFLNGPRHALAVAEALHAEFPDVTFDVTAKIEHLLRHRSLLPALAAAGCVFVVSAAESLDDAVLAILDKGHTRAGFFDAVAATRAAGIALRPTWIAFTPWTTLDGYREWLDVLANLGFVDAVDPVQYAIRLLVPPGSLLADHSAMSPHLGPLVAGQFHYRWSHPDPRMEGLWEGVNAAVAAAVSRGEDAGEIFERVRRLADETAGAPVHPPLGLPADRRRPPRLTEPWFC